MRVMIYEPGSEGHRLTYARYVMEAVLEAGCEVVFSTARDVPKSLEYQLQLSHLARQVEVDAWIGEGSEAGQGPARGLPRIGYLIGESIRRVRPDHVLVTMADGVSQGMGYTPKCIPKGTEIEGLFMRGRWAYPSPTLKQKFRSWVSLKLTARARWTGLFHLDELAADAIQKRGGRLARISEFMPHALEPAAGITREEARLRMGLDPESYYFGCLGAISERKGIRSLLEAVQSPACPPQVKLLLVGKCAEDVKDLAQSEAVQKLVAAGRVVMINRYVTDEELMAAYAASDCIATLYTDVTLPASIVLNAANQGKPVLGSDKGWIGHVIRKYELGWTCDPENIGEIVSSLGVALPLVRNFRRSARSLELSNVHTIENFKAKWTKRIRERLQSGESGCRRSQD